MSAYAHACSGRQTSTLATLRCQAVYECSATVRSLSFLVVFAAKLTARRPCLWETRLRKIPDLRSASAGHTGAERTVSRQSAKTFYHYIASSCAQIQRKRSVMTEGGGRRLLKVFKRNEGVTR